MAPGWILHKQLMIELGLTPGFLEYHTNIGAIPAHETWGQNRIYFPEAADAIRTYVAGRKKGQHRKVIKNEGSK